MYREREVRPSLGNLTGRYRAGLPVMALYDRTEAVLGSLALPAPTLAGGCVPAPVAFLRPRRAVCRRALSPAVCAAAKNSALDHQMYLMSSAAIAQEPHFPQVMAENNALRVAATETTYYAAHNPELYFSAPGPRPAPAPGATDLDAVRARVTGGGAGEQLFLSGHTRLGAVQSVAHLEPASLACTNLVLEARYELVWAGPRILQVAALRAPASVTTSCLQVRAAVLLGNISLAQRQNVSIRQHFQVKSLVCLVWLPQSASPGHRCRLCSPTLRQRAGHRAIRGRGRVTPATARPPRWCSPRGWGRPRPGRGSGWSRAASACGATTGRARCARTTRPPAPGSG